MEIADRTQRSRPLDGLRALVTGGSRGLGAAIARRLATDGATVTIVFTKNRAEAENTAKQIQLSGGTAEIIQADVSSPARVQQMFANLSSLDILVNNAGINRDGPFMTMSLEDWDSVHHTNLRSAFLCCQLAAKLMQDGKGGSIINIGATTGVRGRTNGVNYCTAKAGLMVMTRCLALELAPLIRVNTVVPGLIPTDETTERFHLDDPDVVAREAIATPLARLGTPSDVAGTVAFLCGKDSSFITGQTHYVTGGAYMGI